jgi:mycothiol synthase
MALTTVAFDLGSNVHVRAAVAVLTATSFDWSPTEQELRKELETTPSHVEEVRFLVFDGDIAVGYCRVGTYRYVVDPERLLATVRVVPSHRRRNIATSLVATMRPWISGRSVKQLWAFTDIDADGHSTCPAGDAFAYKNGLRQRETRFESILDTTEIDLTVVTSAIETCAAQGIVVTSIETLLTDPAWRSRPWQRELYEVDCTSMIDEHTEQGGEPNPFDEWADEFLTGRDLAAMFVAVHDGSIVGLSMNWHEEDTILVAATGTLPAFRGRGVARAMKLAGAAYAQGRGLSLRAFNADNNPHIVELNRSLGFRRKAGQVYWKLMSEPSSG